MLNTLSQSIGNTISHYLLPLGEKGLEINEAVAEELHTLQTHSVNFVQNISKSLSCLITSYLLSLFFAVLILVLKLQIWLFTMTTSMFLLLKNLRALFKRDDFVSAFFSSINNLDDGTLITDFVNAGRRKSSAFL